MPRSIPCPFFKRWTPESAYVLGYWFADGNMYTQKSCGSYVVSIGSKDREHLERLRDVMEVGKLTRITGSEVYKLVICRKEMYDDLLRLGGTERKSLTLTWPYVPQEHLAHLVRGYVDGDGSLTWHRSGNSVHPLIGAVGTREFLLGMASAVEQLTGIPSPTCHHDRSSANTWIMNWYGVRAKCLAIWLYHDNLGLCLARKYALATTFSAWRPRVFDPSTMTTRMWQLFGGYIP